MADTKKKDKTIDKKNWYNDRYQYAIIQRNILAIVTLFSLICSIAATFSISALVPLKSVEPFVIQIDQKSGVTQVVDPLKAKELMADEAISNYFMVQFVRARESYLGSLERTNYYTNIVRVLATSPVYAAYKYQMTPGNPESFATKLGANGSREVKIGSIKFLDKQVPSPGEESKRYLIKMQITETMGATAKVINRLAIIEIKYVELELSIEDRYLNPIGFRVVSYRVDDDNS